MRRGSTLTRVTGRLSRSAMMGYGVGAFGTTAFGTVPGLMLAIFLTDSLGVAAGLASIVLLVPKVWDAVFMPYVGRLCDRLGSPSRLLVAGSVGIALGFPLMFTVPAAFTGVAAALWVLVAFVIAATAFALYVVPYIALSAEITDSAPERTSLMSWRVAFQGIGILTFGVGAPFLREAFDGGPKQGYTAMGLAVGALAGIALLASWRSTRRLPRYVTAATAPSESTWDQFREAIRLPPLRTLLAAFALQAVATGAILTGLAYYSTYVLGIASYGLTFGILLLPMVLTMPVWAAFGRRFGKRRGYVVASLILLFGVLASPLALAWPAWIMLVILATAASGYAGMQLFPLAMLPDTIQSAAQGTGVHRAGGFTGVWVAVETVAFAIGPALFLIIVQFGGFDSSTTGGAVQPSSAIIAIVVGFGIVPALLVAASIPLILRWRLSHVGAAR